MRTTVATILALSFAAFSICGAGMLCMEQFAHYSVLASSLPVQLLTISLLLLVLTLIVAPAADVLPAAAAVQRPTGRDPDIVFRPLQLAFADGILNPKPF